MTDGQIYMSTPLFSEGFRPAIDMGLSVSRIGSKVQWRAMKGMTGMLQLEFVRFKELEKLTRIKAGASPDVQKRLKKGRVLEEVLKQSENQPVPMVDQVMILFALQNGFLDDVEPAEVRARLNALIAQIRKSRPDLVKELIAGRELTDQIREGLLDELRRFGGSAV
jgi:F-type H+-transporting ATPase subunit alpha